MSNITIKKATLTSGNGLSLELSERQKDGSFIDSNSTYSAAVHNDLREAYRRLGIHLALASEYRTLEELGDDIDKPDADAVKPFTVNSVTFLPDESGVKISGSVELSNAKKLPLAPPAIKWDDEDGYEYSSELAEISSLVMSEIEAYLNGKHAPEPQQELPFGEDPEDAN